MDMNKVRLKFKMNAKQTHHIAYCEEYPEIQGIGPSEGQATADFWRAFNNAEDKNAHQATQQKKQKEKVAAAEQNKDQQHKGTKKKAA